MTCKEKFRLEHPDRINEQDWGGCNGCPHDYGYLNVPEQCLEEGRFEYSSPGHCRDCWNREIPEEKLTYNHDSEPVAKVLGTTEENGGLTVCCIKDSGSRREFETGAVRDIQEGKGRCDLLPLDVVSDIYKEMFDDDDTSSVIRNIYNFQETSDVTYLMNALDKFEGFDDDTSSTLFLETAKQFEEGAKKYGEYNWQKGIPTHCYIDSAVRHYLKWLRGDKDEPHDRAFCWNILCCIWTCIHKPELNDYCKEDASDAAN
jgi:hypothetical protein